MGYRPTGNPTSPLALTGELEDVSLYNRRGNLVSKHRAKHRASRAAVHDLRDLRQGERIARQNQRIARRAERDLDDLADDFGEADGPMGEFEALDPEAFEASGLVVIGNIFDEIEVDEAEHDYAGDLDDAVYDNPFLRLARGARYGG